MAIYKTETIKDKCIKLWHPATSGKNIELTNPKRDGNWHIPEDKYDLLIDESKCEPCIEHNSKDWVMIEERDRLRREAWNNNKLAY